MTALMAKDQYYLTAEWNPERSAYLAVISIGSPQVGDAEVTVCDADWFHSMKKARKWFKSQVAKKPWEAGPKLPDDSVAAFETDDYTLEPDEIETGLTPADDEGEIPF